MEQRDPRLAATIDIAQQAGSLVRAYYREEIEVHIKEGDERNLVTEADLAAERFILRALRASFPSDSILSEEGYRPGDRVDPSRATWLVDPIDGTSNFAHESPLFAISIGLLAKGQPELGVIHAPVPGWTFSGSAGRGAMQDGAPLRVSERDLLARAIVACDWSRSPDLRRLGLEAYADFGERVHSLRALGSAALGLAAVAAGWVDVYFNFLLMPWDTAAGVLLVREAGGMVTALDGEPWRPEVGQILATNGTLHQAALDVLARHLPPG